VVDETCKKAGAAMEMESRCQPDSSGSEGRVLRELRGAPHCLRFGPSVRSAEVRKVRSSESDQAGGGTGRSGAVGPDRNGMTRSEIPAGSDRYCSWGF